MYCYWFLVWLCDRGDLMQKDAAYIHDTAAYSVVGNS
jgi:hypothetical protein